MGTALAPSAREKGGATAAVLGAALVLSAAVYNDTSLTLNPAQPTRVPAPISNIR